MSAQLEGKVALVTGGASGIGRACALRFAADGADVVIADLNPERGHAVVAAVQARGRRGLFVPVDVGEDASCEAMADAAVAAFLAGEEAGFITGEILFVDGGTFTG